MIAFYTGKNDQAHISYVKEALSWFPQAAATNNFLFEATKDWNNMNDDFLSNYQVAVFLDTRPEDPEQRAAFQRFMEKGGGWLGFHFSAFALSPSAYPQNWDWYHNIFLGSGQYKSNTWRPTSALLKVEDRRHPSVKGLGMKFTASPNEWYRWQNDLKANPDIEVLVSIDPESFPLGTGPKPHEIWHEGYYPVVWTNTRYKMLYVNMGHNDIDYEHKVDTTNSTLSFTFANKIQNKMITNALLWLGSRKK
ncbi:MAG: ThuA domain-containing protein [Daejeonella sp.]|uniref:ThuA domain-containing protein n=1 Tax=Daejeonella sp. JGW-45 TaxID=3034148 RepID=UPI0023EB6AEC|nr:ThuA domain-containing protein [Daejeonella sp. JGW-45]